MVGRERNFSALMCIPYEGLGTGSTGEIFPCANEDAFNVRGCHGKLRQRNFSALDILSLQSLVRARRERNFSALLLPTCRYIIIAGMEVH